MPCGAGGHGLLGLRQTEEPKQLTAMFGPASCWLVTLQFGSFRQIPMWNGGRAEDKHLALREPVGDRAGVDGREPGGGGEAG